MTILLLGGRGKTASRIAWMLHAANVPFLVASRSTSATSPFRQATFDWLHAESYESPFLKASAEGMAPITTAYLVPPPIFDLSPPMIQFIDYARQKGVKRFVLLSASTIEKGGPAMGQVHEHLASSTGIEYAVLRPTWFMENFSSPHEPQQLSIRDEDRVYSAAGEGKIPFVSADDIAQVAFHVLRDMGSSGREYLILGPELLTYSQVASILTSVLGRKISHEHLSEAQLSKHLERTGMPADDAGMMASMDAMIKGGAEERLNGVVQEVTGKPPLRFYDFAMRERHIWTKAGTQSSL